MCKILICCLRSGLDSQGTGTGGSSYDGSGQNYPGVPFSNQVNLQITTETTRYSINYRVFHKLQGDP